MALESKGAAIMIKDPVAKEMLFQTLVGLTGDEKRQSQLRENIARMAIPDAADRIAEEALALTGKYSHP